LITGLGTFFGLQALSFSIGIFQLKSSVALAFYLYAFLVVWMTFLFDLHLKKRGVLANARLNHKGFKMVWEAFKERVDYVRHWKNWRHFQNYLLMPCVIYWSVFALMVMNPFDAVLKQGIIVSSSIALTVTYWFLKEHVSRQLESTSSWVHLLSATKLFAAFLAYSALVGITFNYGYNLEFLVLWVFAVTFFLVYQALFQHDKINFQSTLWIVMFAVVQALSAYWIYANWNTEYFAAGVAMVAVYNTLWGLLHHHLDKNLSRKVVFEYLTMLVLVISILFANHNFNQKVI
jgi:hypothetical protein